MSVINAFRANRYLMPITNLKLILLRSARLLPILAGISCTLILLTSSSNADTPPFPQSPDGSVKVTLFAADPQIVTPIGITVDPHGRVFVIESNSHFRPKDYKGPATDRIRILADPQNTGHADQITTFYEGENYLMNLVADRDGSILVSSRNEIFRLVPGNGTDEKPRKISLAKLDTAGNYPHNGLHGLALAADGSLYFGIGENSGTAWTLTGTDTRKLGDDKGAGAIFHIDSKGRELVMVSRGFWNPFGMGTDPAGNIWAVDNDPDGRPPCRLIQVVPGGDYGYEYRYGRTGMHPLQAWDGELPGTLRMVTGVGEAPCAVRWQQDRLLVSSWRDHQVQSYALTPRGASYTAEMKPLLVGTDDFRPVGLATAPDGSMYVTDWSSASYSVNGKGRVWKLTFANAPAARDLKLTPAMRHATELRQSEDVPTLINALDDPDPTTAQAAQYGLSRLAEAEKIKWASLTTAPQRIGLLAALLWRGSGFLPYLGDALKDPDDRVRQMAVRVIAEKEVKESRPQLELLLQSDALSPRLLGMTLAAIGQLDGDKTGKIDAAKINSVLLSRMNAAGATDQTKAVSLHLLMPTHPKIPLNQLQVLLQSPTRQLQLETVRYLNSDTHPARYLLLAQIAADATLDPNLRAEAIVGLADDAAARIDLLLELASGSDAVLRQESLRSLRGIAPKWSLPQQEQLKKVAVKFPADAESVNRLLGQAASIHPTVTDTSAWQKILDQSPGDPEAGRRIFFHPSGPACYRCHMIEGRGRAIGPDLSMIGHSQSREHVLESILTPSREIAPLFTFWTVTTKDGKKVDGILLRRDGQSKEVYVDASGIEVTVLESNIVDRKIRKESIMPDGLIQSLTDQELRDLLALLIQKR